MSLHLEPSEPGREPSRQVRVARPQPAHRQLRSGRRLVAEGTLRCPACEVPLAPPPRLRADAEIACPWCAQRAPAHRFVDLERATPPAGRVVVTARLATPARAARGPFTGPCHGAPSGAIE